MAAFNLFVKEVTVTEWTAEGGTALEILGRETLEPSFPAEAKIIKTSAAAAKESVKFTLPAGLTTELNEGAKVIAATLHVCVKHTVNSSKQIKITTNSPALSSEPEASSSGQKWQTLAFSKAQAEELTKAKLEALVATIERLSGAPKAYEFYLSLETEKAAEVFSGATTNQAAMPQVVTGRKIMAAAVTEQVATSRSLVGVKAAAGAVTEKVATADILVGAKRNAGTVSEVVGIAKTLASVKLASGITTQTFITTRTLSGARQGIGSAPNLIALTDSPAGRKTTSNTITEQVGLVDAFIGVRHGGGEEVFSGPIIESLGMPQKLTGSKLTTGTMRESAGFSDPLTGAKLAGGATRESLALSDLTTSVSLRRGAVSQVAGMRSSQAGQSLRLGAVTARLGALQAAAGAKLGQGALTRQIALLGSLTGVRRGKGSFTQQIALVKEWVIIAVPTNGIATADVYLRYIGIAEVRVRDEAEGSVNVKDTASEEVAI